MRQDVNKCFSSKWFYYILFKAFISETFSYFRGYVHLSAGVLRGQKGALDHWELQLQMPDTGTVN